MGRSRNRNRTRRVLVWGLIALTALVFASPLARAAAPAPDLTAPCSLRLVLLTASGRPLSGGRAAVYAVADWAPAGGDGPWVYTGPFAACGVPEAELGDSASAAALARYAESSSLSCAEADLGQDGEAAFPSLSAGLYLVVQTAPAPGFQAFPAFLLALPLLSPAGDGYCYAVTAQPKAQPEPGEAPEPPGPPAEPPADQPEPDPPPEDQNPPVFPDPPAQPEPPAEPDPPGGPILPQTGQLWWPVPLLTAAALALLLLSRVLGRPGRNDE